MIEKVLFENKQLWHWFSCSNGYYTIRFWRPYDYNNFMKELDRNNIFPYVRELEDGVYSVWSNAINDQVGIKYFQNEMIG